MPTMSNEHPQQPCLMDLREASAYIGIPIWTLREQIWRGVLPAIRLPGANGEPQRRIRIAKRDLDCLIERFREVASPE